MTPDEKRELFWQVADPLLTRSDIKKGTMMGFPCLRVDGQFFASIHKDTGDMVIKLPKDRVTELIEAGAASAFAPNGRTFKEWALIDEIDESKWREYLDEALDFVSG